MLGLLCVLSLQARAQPPALGDMVYYWQDSFNMRIHLNHYQPGDIVYYAPRQWSDPQYNSQRLFRHDAIAAMKQLAVTARWVPMPRGLRWNNRSDLAALAREIDSIGRSGTATGTVHLRYDAQGYLQQQITHKHNGDPKYVDADTNTYTYTPMPDGGLLVTMRQQHYQYNGNKNPSPGSRYLYASIYSGTFNTGPLTRLQQTERAYRFGKDGKLKRLTSRYRAWANGKTDYDTTQSATSTTYSYDAHGRILSVTDSLPERQQPVTIESYTCRDAQWGADTLLQLPLIRQYLSTIPKPYVQQVVYSLYSWRDGRGGYLPAPLPHISILRYLCVYDGQHRLRLSIGTERQGTLATAYTSGADSLGQYRAAISISQYSGNLLTDAVYDPALEREQVTEQHGHLVEIYYKTPPGTLDVSELKSSERNEIFSADGWRLMAYTPGYNYVESRGAFFAPLRADRYSNALQHMENFVLIDPQGRLRYLRNGNELCVIDY